MTSLSLFPKTSTASDILKPNQTLTDSTGGNFQVLISAGEAFALGFFSPYNSNNRYVGIWFNKVPQQTVVWVANKNSPIVDFSGELTITADGNIIIRANRSELAVWSSNSSSTAINSPFMQLLNNGNLVITEGGGRYLWQSFDYPCDTLIPGMKLGVNRQTGQTWFLTSWKGLQDPSVGDYTYKLDHRGLPQVVLRRGSTITYRSGPWDGLRFGGGPKLKENPVFNPIFVFNSTYVYYAFENYDASITSRFVVNQSGGLLHLRWNLDRQEWVEVIKLQGDTCDDYKHCGPYGICNPSKAPICNCPFGFTPKLSTDWARLDYSGGCNITTPLNCSAGDKFKKVTRLKLPDTSSFLVDPTISPVQCEEACLRNCSCVAYAKTEVSGCVVWHGELLDLREYTEGGQDLYIRMAASALGSQNNKKRTVVAVSVSVIALVLLLGLITYHVARKKRLWKRQAQGVDDLAADHDCNHGIVEEDLELPLFDLVTIATATKNFSLINKIGEGGFGLVYKGELSTGQEIAVKRLSQDSGQGLKEFKNEVIMISKLQHRNLVKLLGCCIHDQERMLIYEYMPNKSLDLFIFNQTRGTCLDWVTRCNIIVGIARGLLYLHRDSRLRIIHRDLKASNILLDNQMNPKISDFGLARIFGVDQMEENTNMVMGTHGYMSPEYAIDGLFSVKSDVFSFGVLVLEIVSGRRNRGFYHPDHDLNLLGHAWRLWTEGRSMEMMDPSLESLDCQSEMLRCIQVGLLCVQQRPEDRPTMSTVLLMLDSENAIVPEPKKPGFYTERFPIDTESSSTGKKRYNRSNELTITMLHGR